MKSITRLKILLCFLATAVVMPTPGLAETFVVNVTDNAFSPTNQAIQVGDTVEWRNAAGGNDHNVTANNDSFSSPTSNEFTFSHTFDETGNFGYRCTVHSSEQAGTINVEVADSDTDLELLSVDATNGTYSPGDSIGVSIFIGNNGNIESSPYTVTYYASTNSTISSVDISLGSDNFPGLAGGATVAASANSAFPSTITEGNYFIGALIEINDTNNGNNSNVHPTKVTILGNQVIPRAELALKNISAPGGSYEQGAAITFSTEIENIGDLGSSNYTVSYYASFNNSISNVDNLLGTQARNALEIGETSIKTFQTTIPENLDADNYFLGAIINFDDGNSSNNVGMIPNAITVTEPVQPAPELVLKGVNAPGGDYEQGAPITFSAEVENQGDDGAPAYTISYYASLNNDISVNDTLLGIQVRDGLEMGETSVAAFETMIPEDLALDNYFLGAIINFDDLNESNNIGLVPGTITVTEPVQPFKINAGLNGTWWGGPQKTGEGMQLEITDAGDNELGIVATFYSYDPLGNQIYLIMVGPVTAETAELEVFITSNGLWGDFFSSDLVDEKLWGTGTVTGFDCENLNVELRPNQTYLDLSYHLLNYDMIRLTTPAAPCPIP